jgi:hypothetical protein
MWTLILAEMVVAEVIIHQRFRSFGAYDLPGKCVRGRKYFPIQQKEQ